MGWGINTYDLVRIPIKKACNVYYLRWYYNGWHYWAFRPGSQTSVTEGEKYRTIGTRKISMGTGQITVGQSMAIRTILNTREVYLLTVYGWMNIRVEPSEIPIYESKVTGNELEITAIIGSKELSYGSGYSPVIIIPVVPPDPLCEVTIGSQIWMCRDYYSNYPDSKVYDDDEANRDIFGGLYTYDQVMSSGFCPIGWHVPSLSEWTTLINYIGNITNAGGFLKSTDPAFWDAPNTGAVNLNGFSAKGAGYYSNSFLGLKSVNNLWTRDEASLTNAYFMQMTKDSAGIVAQSLYKTLRLSVRLIKDGPPLPLTFADWFLPSKDELNAMYTELHLYGVGGFTLTSNYACSTEYADEGFPDRSSTCIDFASGVWSSYLKDEARFVRACRAFTSPTNYNLRDIGQSGGLIFWKSGNDYLEAAPVNLNTGLTVPWSNVDMTAIGASAQGTAVGTGQANTTAIINQVGHTNSAAKLCDNLVITY